MSARVLGRFLDQFEGEGDRESRHPRRKNIRVRYRLECIPVRLKHPNGAESTVRMPSTNLSSTGIAMLHNAYLHLGTRVALALRDPDGGFRRVTGELVRCQHLTANIHEVGIRFDESVHDLVRGLLNSQEEEDDSQVIEPVDPSLLQGNVLYVDDSKNDRTLLKHYIRNTKIDLVTEGTFGDGLNAAMRPLDLMIFDFRLDEDRTGAQLAELVREMGSHAPILIITSDGSMIARREICECHADALLMKPVDEPRLLSVLGEFLVVHSDMESWSREAAEDPAVSAMIDDFVNQIPDTARKLADAATMNDQREARRICFELGNGAGSLGFPKLAELVGATAGRLSDVSSTETCQAEIQRVISACRAISAA